MGFDDIFSFSGHLNRLGFGRSDFGLGGLARSQRSLAALERSFSRGTTRAGLWDAIDSIGLTARPLEFQRMIESIPALESRLAWERVNPGLTTTVIGSGFLTSNVIGWPDFALGTIGKHFGSVDTIARLMQPELTSPRIHDASWRDSRSVFEEIIDRQNSLFSSLSKRDDPFDWRRFWSAQSSAVRDLAEKESMRLPATIGDRSRFVTSEIYEELTADLDTLDLEALLDDLLGENEAQDTASHDVNAPQSKRPLIRISPSGLRVVAFSAAGAACLTVAEQIDGPLAYVWDDFRDNFLLLLAAGLAVIVAKNSER
ncbi:MAG: hypothetical protein M3279_10885 [Actinomycetota bacterium]|nr:hypothetical protein [Actinomycetota bacterium]